jgi:hypothetical protein
MARTARYAWSGSNPETHMKILATIALLALWAGAAGADTFELSDPANEMHAEWEAKKAEEQREADQRIIEEIERAEQEAEAMKKADIFCTMDNVTDRCFCIDRNTVRTVDLPQEECKARVAQAAASE